MKTEQCNLRVLPQHKSLIKDTSNRLKADPAFEQKLCNLLTGALQTSSAFEIDLADVKQRLSKIESTVEGRLFCPPQDNEFFPDEAEKALSPSKAEDSSPPFERQEEIISAPSGIVQQHWGDLDSAILN